MTKYYADAWRTGVYPTVTKDQIFLSARPHSRDLNVGDPIGKPNNWQWVWKWLATSPFKSSTNSDRHWHHLSRLMTTYMPSYLPEVPGRCNFPLAHQAAQQLLLLAWTKLNSHWALDLPLPYFAIAAVMCFSPSRLVDSLMLPTHLLTILITIWRRLHELFRLSLSFKFGLFPGFPPSFSVLCRSGDFFRIKSTYSLRYSSMCIIPMS